MYDIRKTAEIALADNMQKRCACRRLRRTKKNPHIKKTLAEAFRIALRCGKICKAFISLLPKSE